MAVLWEFHVDGKDDKTHLDRHVKCKIVTKFFMLADFYKSPRYKIFTQIRRVGSRTDTC